MLTACGFHIDFQFRVKKSLPRDLQMVMASPDQEMVQRPSCWTFWPGTFFQAIFMHIPTCANMYFCPATNLFLKKPCYCWVQPIINQKGIFHTRHTPSDITLQIGNLPPTHYAKGNTSNKLGKLEMADLQSAMTQFNYRPICNYRPEGPNPQKK